MSTGKTFLDRVVESFTGNSNQAKPHSRKRSLQLETLEPREMLTAVGFSTVVHATEGPEPVPGYFQVERDNTAGTLTVYYQMDYRNGGDSCGGNCEGWARNGIDFQQLPGTNSSCDNYGSITFVDGCATVDIPIVPIDDHYIENDEKIVLTLRLPNDSGCGCDCGGGASYNVDAGRASSTLYIYDDEEAVTVRINEVVNAVEGGQPGYIELIRDTTGNPLTVYYELHANNGNDGCGGGVASWALSGTDFQCLPGTTSYNRYGSVTFGANDDMVRIAIVPIDDSYIEGSEKIELTLRQSPGSGCDGCGGCDNTSNGVTYHLDPLSQTATAWIIDDDEPVTVRVHSVQNAVEGGSRGFVKLVRDNTAKALTVYYRLHESNRGGDCAVYCQTAARLGDDFSLLPGSGGSGYGSITFAAGEAYATIEIVPVDDDYIEGTEWVELTLTTSHDDGCGCGSCQDFLYLLDSQNKTATVTILDNDDPVHVWIDSTQDGAEGGQNGYFRLMRSNSEKGLTVYYALDSKNSSCCYTFYAGYGMNGVDFACLPGTNSWNPYGSVTFAAGQDCIDIPVNVFEDSKVEGTEKVLITLLQRPGSDCGYGCDSDYENDNVTYLLDASRKTASLDVFDNDQTLVWFEKGADAYEGGSSGYVLLKRDRSSSPLTVRYEIDRVNGTATPVDDFMRLPGTEANGYTATVTFGIGVDTIRIDIIPEDDNIPEHPETVVLKILTAPPQQNVQRSSYGYDDGCGCDSGCGCDDGCGCDSGCGCDDGCGCDSGCGCSEPLGPAYSAIPGGESVTVIIHDNDPKPIVWIDTVGHGEEGGVDGFARLRRSDASDSLRVRYRLDDTSTAIHGDDFDFLPGMEADSEYGYVTFAAGSYTVDIPIRVIDDLEIESTETVTITLLPDDQPSSGVNNLYELDLTRLTGIVSIYDNEIKPAIRIESIRNGTEGGQNGYFRLYRDTATGSLTVHYLLDVAGSTASMGIDFARLPGMADGGGRGSVTFAAGQAYVDIPVMVLDDTLIEGDETVRIILLPQDDTYTLDDRYEAELLIVDNDFRTTIGINSVQSGKEGERDGSIKLRRDRTDQPLTVTYEYDVNASTAIFGTDFGPLSGMITGTNTGSVTFGIGEEYAYIHIPVPDDRIIEETKSLLVRIHQGDPVDATSYYLSGKKYATVEIEDDDIPPVVQVDSVQSAYEGETGSIRLHRTETEGPLTVRFRLDESPAVYGDDFVFGGIFDAETMIGSVTFADGQQYVDIAVHALSDFALEWDETVAITLLESSGSTYSLNESRHASLTIFDSGIEAPAPEVWRVGVVASDPFASENGPNSGEFTIVRSGNTDLSTALTVRFEISGSAVFGSDYTGLPVVYDAVTQTWQGIITIPVGERYVTLSVDPSPDLNEEGTETVILTLLEAEETDESGNPVYSLEDSSSATVYIEDTVTISDPGGAQPAVTVWDVSVFASDPRAAEDGRNSGEFTIVRSGPEDYSGPLTVSFEITGTATYGLDYDGFQAVYDAETGTWRGTVTFQGNQKQCTIQVIPQVDDQSEGTETVILRLLPTTEIDDEGQPLYTVASASSAVVRIEDSVFNVDPLENLPTRETWDVSVVATDAYASENGPDNGEFTIVRSGLSDFTGPLTVWFEISGAASYGADYTGFDAVYDSTSGKWRGFVTFQSGQKQFVLKVVPQIDDLVEGTEHVVLTLLPSGETVSDGQPSYVVTDISAEAVVGIEDRSEVEAGTPWISCDPELLEGRYHIIYLHANEAAVLRWEIDWGDGSPIETVDGSATRVEHPYDDGDEHYAVRVVVVTEVAVPDQGTGREGLSHGYWKNHASDWTFFKTTDDYEAVFGVGASPKPGTLMQAIKSGGGGVKALWRESVAALMNATHPNIHYRYTVEEIISMVQTAYATGRYEYYKDILELENTRGADIKNPSSGGSSSVGKIESRIEFEKGLYVKNVAPELVISGEVGVHPNTIYTLRLESHDPGIDTITHWLIDWGDGKQSRVEGNPSQTTHIYTLPGDYTITATATDEDGTWSSNSVDVRVYVSHDGPVVGTPWISGDSQMYEGRKYELDLHANRADILYWEIDWGDGSPIQPVGATTSKVSHFYGDGDESYEIKVVAVYEIAVPVTGTGQEGLSHGYWKNHASDWTGYVTGDNYETVFGVSSSQKPGSLMQAINTGGGKIKALWRESVAALMNAMHPNIDYRYTVDQIVSMVQTAYETGEYNLYKDILEKENTRGADIKTPSEDGSSGTRTEEVRVELFKHLDVLNVPPTLVITGSQTALPDREYSIRLSSDDPGDDTITHWTINWGDGIITVEPGDPSEARHTYTTEGTYTITATATDEDGTWNANSLTVAVRVPETGIVEGTPWISGDPWIYEGRYYVLDLHANKADILRWEIDWGDGSVVEIVEGDETFIRHFYADGDNEFIIDVVAVRQRNGSNDGVALEMELSVHNVPPVLVISGDAVAQIDKGYDLTLGSDDPGDDTITHWTINWGDGTIAVVPGNPSEAQHTYASEGTYTVTATAMDEDGTWSSNSLVVQVVDKIDDGWKSLAEEDRFLSEVRLAVEVTGEKQALVLSTRNLRFDGGSTGMINDAFEVALVDENGTPLTATIRATRDGALNITEGEETIAAHGVSYDAGTGRITIDLSRLPVGLRAELVLRLVNNDSDRKTMLEYRPVLEYIDSPFGTLPNTVPQENPGHRQRIDFNHLQDITQIIDFRYGVTTFNDQKELLRAGVTLMNIGHFGVSGPILVGIRNISDPTVSVANYDGMTPDGMRYFDVSHFAFSGLDTDFDPGEIIRGLDLQFLNPNHVRFTYELVVLAHVNEGPSFVTKPVTEAAAGTTYIYESRATDPENDTVRYELVGGPQDMTVDTATGTITWTVMETDIGQHPVVIRAYDSYGLYDEQRFAVHVAEAKLNGSPVFTSVPVVQAYVGQVYTYDSTAVDPDDDTLTYSILDAVCRSTGQVIPPDYPMTIDSATGLVHWNPPASLVGETIRVALTVNDGHGHTAFQIYDIVVLADPVNHPPIIISTPGTIALPDKWYEYKIVGYDQDDDVLRYTLVSGPEGMAVNPDSGRLMWKPTTDDVGFHDVTVRVEDGRGGWDEQTYRIEVPKMTGSSISGNVFHDINRDGDRNIYGSSSEQYVSGQAKVWLAGMPEGTDGMYGDRVPYQSPVQVEDIVLVAGQTLSFSATGLASIVPYPWGHTSADGANPYENYDGIFGISRLVAPECSLIGVFLGDGRPDLNPTPQALNFCPEVDYSGSGYLNVAEGLNYTIFSPELQQPFFIGDGLTDDGILQQIVIPEGATRFYLGILDRQPFNDNSGFYNVFVYYSIAPEPGLEGRKIYADLNNNGIHDQMEPFAITDAEGNYTITDLPEGDYVIREETHPDWVRTTPNASFTVTVGENEQLTGYDFGLVEKLDETPNDPPEFDFDPPRTGKIGETYFCQAKATDPEGGPISYSLKIAPQGMTIDAETGRIVWTPEFWNEGNRFDTWTNTVVVAATDGAGAETVFSFDILIRKPEGMTNTVPAITSAPDRMPVLGKAWSYQVVAHDPDGDPLSYSLDPTSVAHGMKIDSDGLVSWTPATTGRFDVRIIVDDGRGGTSWQILQFDVRDVAAPQILSTPESAFIGEPWHYALYIEAATTYTISLDEHSLARGFEIDHERDMILWTPNQIGEFSVVITVTDENGSTATQTFLLPVRARSVVSNPPVITSTPMGPVYASEPWEYQVEATDPDGDALYYWLVDENGEKIRELPGGLLVWPLPAVGEYEFIIRVYDSHGAWAEQSFTVHVEQRIVRQSPPKILSVPTGPARVGDEWTYELNVRSEADWTVSLDLASVERGFYIDGNRICWTPGTDGEFSVSVTVTDIYGSATQTFTLPVLAVPVPNEAPMITSEPTGPVFVGDAPWSYTITATDADSDTLTYWLIHDDGSREELLNPTISWEPDEAGSRQFVIRVEDGRGGYAEQRFTIHAIERPAEPDGAPWFTSVPTTSILLGETYAYQVSAFDPEGDTLTFSLIDPHAGMTLDADGNLSWEPVNPGNFTVRIAVTDGTNEPVVQQFTIAVVAPPVVNRNPEITSKPSGYATVDVPWKYRVTATDPDGDTLFYWLVDAAGNKLGQLDGGFLIWKPDEPGRENFIVRVEDGQGGWAEQSFGIEAVLPEADENLAPRILSIPTRQVLLDSPYVYKIVAQDPDGDSLTYTLAEGPNGMTIAPDGTVRWLPQTLGNYRVKILVHDGVNEPVEQIFTLAVIAPVVANTAPRITSTPSGGACRGRDYSYQLTAVDDDGDTIVWSIDTSKIPENARGNLAISVTGLLTWTPMTAGEFEITIVAGDGKAETRQILLLPVAANAPPSIVSEPILSVDKGGRYEYTVSAQDPNGDPVTYFLEKRPDGMTIDAATGLILWDDPQIAGSYEIVVVARDDTGASSRQSFTLRVVDNDPVTNSGPVVEPIPAMTIPATQQFVYRVVATDAEGDPLFYSLVDPPEGMAISSSGTIFWTPGTAQVSGAPQRIVVQVTDRVNDPVTVTFELTVVAVRQNNPPKITSKPDYVLPVNTAWSYQIAAHDPDGDHLTYSLVDPPSGMTIDAETGLVTWKPDAGQIGQHWLKVRVYDNYGLGIGQDVVLYVQATNAPPSMDPVEFPTLYLGETETVQISASDPAGLELSYELSLYGGGTLPAGLSIDEQTGLITWTPETTGVFDLQIMVYNSAGLATGMLVSVPIEASRPNKAPVITSIPDLNIVAGTPWKYQLEGYDPEGEPVSFAVADGCELPTEMIFDGSTGLVTWTPSDADVGRSIRLHFEISDGQKSSSQWFTLAVAARNFGPSVSDIPARPVTAGATLRIDVKASDPENDRLFYSLDDDSLRRGMTIDAYGRIAWKPGTSDIGAGTATVYVTDRNSEAVSKEFVFVVTADSTPPSIAIGFSKSNAPYDSNVVVTVSVTDDVAVRRTALLLKEVRTHGGETIALNETIEIDASGQATFRLAERHIGTLVFEATATDTSDNIGTISAEFVVTDPRDVDAPVVTLLPVSADGKVTGPVDLRGTIFDESGVNWTVSIVPSGGGQSKVIASGTGNVENETICTFDPTLLRNGDYDILVTARDAGNHVTQKRLSVTVEGEYKLGNFSMSFVDFDLQLAGFPITISRTYDTLNADVMGDFGYGWSLDIAHYKLQVDYGDGELSDPNPNRKLQAGDTLYFTLPDGTKEGFVFQPQPIKVGYWSNPNFYNPKFIPLYGTKSELLYDGSIELLNTGYGFEDNYGLNYSYTPFNSFFGGVSLKLRNGTVLNFDLSDGMLASATDMSGNKLHFHDNGISHSSGKGVAFERDYQGRITSITGPNGDKMLYEYDAKGNLVAVTEHVTVQTKPEDRITTRFTYFDTPAHYLDKIYDAEGNPAARTVYGEDGRIKEVIDASGNKTTYEFDTVTRIQKVTDQLGNVTIIENDARGNVVREETPGGGITLYSYDSNGNSLTETIVVKRDGQPDLYLTTSYTYDADGNKLSETDWRGNVTSYTYNSYGQLTSSTSGGVTTYTYYNAQTGLPTSTTDVNGNTTRYNFDDRGNMTSLVNSEGVQLITSTYNKYGEVTNITSIGGRTTYMTYDLNGDCIESYYVEDGMKVLDKTFYDEARCVIGRERWLIPVQRLRPLGSTGTTTTEPKCLWSTQTVYTPTGQVAVEVDQNGLMTEYLYDIRGLQIEVRTETKNSAGKSVWYVQRTVYDAAGRAVYSTENYRENTSEPIRGTKSVYDADGRVIRGESLLGLVIDITGTSSRCVREGEVLDWNETAYNNAGWVVESTDRHGLRTRYKYNEFGETTQTRRELSDGTWLVSETAYDEKGRVVFSTDSHLDGTSEPVYGTETIYDLQGRAVRTIRYANCQVDIDDATGESTVTARGTELYRSSTEYDSKGRVKSSTDAYGNFTTYEYDNLDRQIAVNQSTGLRSETVYNSDGQVERTISNIKITSAGTYDYSDAIVSINTYNMYGQVIKTETDGRIVEYEYDDLGRQIAVIDHPTIVDGVTVRHRSETVYDDYGRVAISRTNVKLFAGGTIDDGEAQELRYVYDDRGNVVKTIFSDGTEISAGYNERGQKISETNQLGQIRYFEYDRDGRLVAVILPEVYDSNSQTMVAPRYEYEYDVYGRQALLRDPNGHETRFEYDAFGNQVSRTLPLGYGLDGVLGTADDVDVEIGKDFTEQSIYDDNGRLFMQISFEGVVTRFLYDTHGRLRQKLFWNDLTDYADESNPPRETWTYTYDSQGRLACVDQNGRRTETAYDSQGRTVSIKTPEGTVFYEYDKFGRQSRVSSDKGDDIGYQYDIFGRLWKVTDNTTDQTTEYEYDLVGNLHRTVLPNGVVTAYEYDSMNRLKRMVTFKDDNADRQWNQGTEDRISEFRYDLDDLGRKTFAEEWFGNGNSQKNEIEWTYDEAGRLVREAFDHYDDQYDQTSDWLYDLVGNRLKQTVNSVDTLYDYDANDRLLTEITGVKETVYDYDFTQQVGKTVTENGDIISDTTYEYDRQGRMAVVEITTSAGVERINYEYDSNGIRISATHEKDGVTTRTEYLNDSLSLTGYSQVLRQTEMVDGEVTKTISYVIGHQRISQIVVENGTEQEYYFTYDGHGSTRALLNLAGAVEQLYAFDAYGISIGFNQAEALTEFLYSGEQFDAKIGQQYLRARYYDPATGRFNRLDPFFGNQSDPQSFHKYVYVHGDPVKGIDPSGEFFSAIGMLSASGIQGHLRAGTGYIQAAFRVYNTVGKLFKLIEYGKQISNLLRIAKTSLDLLNAGTPLPSALITSITQVFNVDAGFSNLNKLFSIFDAIKSKVQDETGKDFKKVFEQLFKDILLSIPRITSKVMANATEIAKITAGTIAHEDFVLVFGLPSPPSGFTHDMSMWVPVKVRGEDYAIGWSKYSGVLFDLGLAVKNPKSPTFKNSFPLWANKKYKSIARIDYWDYNGGWTYHPHYHTWGESAHHYLDERYI